jgi:hypothetical protein
LLDPINTFVPAETDVHLHVLAGDLQSTSGKTCSQIIAQPGAGILIFPLAILPATVFSTKKSLLLVPNGCIGGPGHDDPADDIGCGVGYSSSTPTAGLVAVGMSRISDPSAIGFQLVHATTALSKTDFRIKPGEGGVMERQLAPSLTPGAIGPYPPFFDLSSTTLGPPSLVQINTYGPGASVPSSTLFLSSALANGGISGADLVNGKGWVLVALGGAPGAAPGPFWQGFTYTLVRADP